MEGLAWGQSVMGDGFVVIVLRADVPHVIDVANLETHNESVDEGADGKDLGEGLVGGVD